MKEINVSGGACVVQLLPNIHVYLALGWDQFKEGLWYLSVQFWIFFLLKVTKI